MDRTNKSKIAINGKLLLRKPRLYQSCSAEEEEDSQQGGKFHLLVKRVTGSGTQNIFLFNEYGAF
jgi:hypothetical protein